MKALLLSAGYGTRLKPITNYIQKCLVPINGKPLLEYWLENLTKVGVKEFLINGHYFPEQVQEFISSSKYKNKITFVYEPELLLTGGTILKNADFFGNEPFIVVHADNLSFCDFNDFLLAHKNRSKNCFITMMTFDTETPKECGVIESDKNGVVTSFFEKVENPPTNKANAAVYIFEPEVIDFLSSLNKLKIDLSTEVIPKFLGQIQTFHNNIYHRDIGNILSYALSQIEISFLIKNRVI